MTIVFLCTSFYPNIGGVEKHVFEVAKRLVRKGNKVVVITEGKHNLQEKVAGIKIYRFNFGEKSWIKKFKIWIKLWKYRELFKKTDIVHCHDVFFWYFPFRFLFLRKKVYTTFHGYETKFPIENKAIFIRKISEKLSFGNICVGDYIKKWYGTNPDYVTYGAIDKIQSSRSKNHKSSKLKILFVGRIEKDMGVEIYAEALRLLKKYKFKFEACGDGSMRNYLEKYGKVHGFVKNINSYILKSDVVFASSYLSILTAMRLRKPVFAVYSNPLKSDYLRKSPFAKWVTIEKSPENLANEIKLIKRHNKKKIELGYIWATKQTWENLTNIYLRLYKQ
ncbi:MAG: glycosyltransferase family 4 protein [Patescibacteria group bacterium]